MLGPNSNDQETKETPIIKGKWRHEGNEIVCGPLRMRIAECEGLSATKCKRILSWICKTMNEAAGPYAVDTLLSDNLAHQAVQVVERRIAKGRILKEIGHTRIHRIM